MDKIFCVRLLEILPKDINHKLVGLNFEQFGDLIGCLMTLVLRKITKKFSCQTLAIKS